MFDEELADVWCTAQKLIGIPGRDSLSSGSSYYSANSFQSQSADLVKAPTAGSCEIVSEDYDYLRQPDIETDLPSPLLGFLEVCLLLVLKYLLKIFTL